MAENESGLARRRQVIEAPWTEDVTHTEPLIAVQDHYAIDARVSDLQNRLRGHVLHRSILRLAQRFPHRNGHLGRVDWTAYEIEPEPRTAFGPVHQAETEITALRRFGKMSGG